MDQKFANDTRFYYKTRMGTRMEILIKTWIFTFPPHTGNVIELNCKVTKKVATPIFTSTPLPLFRVYPPILAKTFVPPPPPPSDSIFGRSYPPPPNKGGSGEGGSNYEGSLPQILLGPFLSNLTQVC